VDDAALPRFEVASVNPGDPNAFGRGMGFRPGAFFVKDSALFNSRRRAWVPHPNSAIFAFSALTVVETIAV
jgi:hypothetical protein